MKSILSAYKLKKYKFLTTRITCPVFTGSIAYAQCQATKLALTKLFIYWDQRGLTNLFIYLDQGEVTKLFTYLDQNGGSSF